MIIKSFSIVDIATREAGKFEFCKGNNLLISNENKSGKSSILKSMYFTLGFDIKSFPSEWNIKDMFFSLEVEINKKKYQITRNKNTYMVSDQKKPLQVKAYSYWLQDKLSIEMKLPNTSTGELHQAYSSAVILPFYIDQDDSWDGILYRNVTSTLGQYKNIPTSIFESVFSLSSIEIQNLINMSVEKGKEIKITDSKVVNLQSVVDEYREELEKNSSISDINREKLKKEIERYLELVINMNSKISKYKVKLLKKYRDLEIQKQELAELNELLKMNEKEYTNIGGECTYCHSKLTREQSISRLKLSNNQFEIGIYKNELLKDIEKSEKNIKEYKEQQNLLNEKIDEINKKINSSKKMLTIDEYIKSRVKDEALNELLSVLEKNILHSNLLNEEKKTLEDKIKQLRKEKEMLKAEMKTEYDVLITKMKRVLTDVNIDELDFLEFKNIAGSGTDKNKKYLAYYLVYMNLLKNYGIYNIPMCMDSFTKNEIDAENEAEMYDAVEKHFMNIGEQSFFSIIEKNTHYLKKFAEYNQINIQKKILSSECYEELLKEVKF